MSFSRLLIPALAILALPACDRQKAEPSQAANGSSPAAETAQAGLDRSQAGKPLPDIEVRDPDGQFATLAELGGKPLLINLWATWCAPCIKELPTLARLAAAQDKVRVIALSQDMQPQPTVDAFLNERRIALEPWQDPRMDMSTALGANILPTTILYGSDGKEIWRYTGDLDWTGAKAAELLGQAK